MEGKTNRVVVSDNNIVTDIDIEEGLAQSKRSEPVPVRGTADGCHLTWRTVLITGGSRGIGAACVRTFAETDGTSRLLQQKPRGGGQARWGDWRTGAFGRPAGYRSGRAGRGGGQRDSAPSMPWSGNAGIAEQKSFAKITGRGLDAHAGCQLMGTVRTIRAVLPEMLHNHKGSIVTVSSMGSAARPARAIIPRARLRLSAWECRSRRSLAPSNIRQLHCAGRDRHRHECHAQCGYHAGVCRSDNCSEESAWQPRSRERIPCICARISRLSSPDRVLGVTGGF